MKKINISAKIMYKNSAIPISLFFFSFAHQTSPLDTRCTSFTPPSPSLLPTTSSSFSPLPTPFLCFSSPTRVYVIILAYLSVVCALIESDQNVPNMRLLSDAVVVSIATRMLSFTALNWTTSTLQLNKKPTA